MIFLPWWWFMSAAAPVIRAFHKATAQLPCFINTQPGAMKEGQAMAPLGVWSAGGLLALLVGGLVWQLLRTNRSLRKANAHLNTALAEERQRTGDRDRFITIIAHDMRKPLLSFRGLTDLVSVLIRQRSYADIQTIANAIDQAGIEIESMFDNLLQWSVLQREGISNQPELVPLRVIIQKVVKVYEPLTRFQNVEIRIDCPDTLVGWVDPDGLELVLRNLTDNALKHVNTFGQVTLTGRVVDERNAELIVQNTGEPLEPERLAYLQAVLAGRVPKPLGQPHLGLGLLLVLDHTQRTGGRVTVASDANQHTTFVVSVPLPALAPADTLLVL